MRSASLSAAQNATASHRTGLEIKTLSINESGTHALIAGKEIFKTVRIEDGRCAEDLNLRSKIRSTPNQASGQPRQIYSIDIADVAWAKGNTGHYVAAATSSGKIIVYDLGHAGLQAAQLIEHQRQVHNVTFSPHQGSLLLSGSQDGTVRLWDIRDVRNQRQVGDIPSKRKFQGQSDGVRDVKWSPTEGLDFAFATDAGELQRWDMRNLKAAKVRVPAHSLACNTVDWHPDGKHIVTAGSDKTIRVFDVSGSRPKRAAWEIKTPHPVMHARWRPSCRSMMPEDNGAGLCTQVVACYDRDHPVMHVWEFRRPLLPFRELHPYPSAPTDMLWHSQDLLWTVGREGTLLQTDIQHAPKLIDRCPVQAIAVSPLGELTFAAQSRKQRRVPKPAPLLETKSSTSTSPPSHLLSRSWADDGVDNSFLRTLPAKGQARAHSNSRVSALPQSSRSPNVSATIKLDDILLNRKTFVPQQIACRGQLPGHNNRKFVAYMAERWATHFQAAPTDEDFLAFVSKAFQDNEDHAASMGLLQTAQTWKVVSHCVMDHLAERMAAKQYRALTTTPSVHVSSQQQTPIESLASRCASQYMKPPAQSPGSSRPVSTIAQQLAVPESTSNVPTPLARPQTGDRGSLPDLDASEGIALPPSLTSELRPPPSSAPRPLSSSARRLTMDSLAEMQAMQKRQTFEETAERSEMVKRWSSQAKTVLNLDPVDNRGVRIPLSKLEDHGSGESFQFLEDSAGSREASFPASFESSKHKGLDMPSAHPTRPRPSRTQTTESLETDEDEVTGDDGGAGSTDFAFSQEVRERRSKALDNKVDLDTAMTSGKMTFLPHTESKKAELHLQMHQAPQHKISRLAVETILDSTPGSPNAVLTDESEVDLEENAIWTLLEMLQELIGFYSNEQTYPQMAAVLLLLVGPLLPCTHPLPASDIHQTVSSYVDYFINSLGWNPYDVPSLVKQCFERPMKAGLQPLQVESIMSTYHEQLLRYQLFNEAAILRKLCYPAYPAVYEDLMGENKVHLMCGQCSRPIAGSSSSLRCPKCKTKEEACPICWMKCSPYQHQGSLLYSCCLLCGHSGHAACLDEWFVHVKGDACPTAGCLCDCVAGTRREAKLAAADAEKRVQAHSRVKSDELKVRQSRAVTGAREQLKK